MKRIFSVFTAVVLTLLLICQNLPMGVYAAEPVECVVYVSETGSDDDGDGSREILQKPVIPGSSKSRILQVFDSP